MNCPVCGKSIPDKSVFCPNCGTRLTQPGGAPSVPQPSPTPQSPTPQQPAQQQQPAEVPPQQPYVTGSQTQQQPQQQAPQQQPVEVPPQQPYVTGSQTLPDGSQPYVTGQQPSNGYQEPRPKKHKKSNRTKFMIAFGATCLAILFILVIGTLVGDFGAGGDSQPAETEAETEAETDEGFDETNDADDMGDGVDAAAFQPNSDGSYGTADAPLEGEFVCQAGDTVYYVSADYASVMSRPRAGGDETTVFTPEGESESVREIVTDGERIYIAVEDFDSSDPGRSIYSVALDGSDAQMIFDVDFSPEATMELYLVGDELTCIGLPLSGSSNEDQQVFHLKVDGSDLFEYDLPSNANVDCVTADGVYYLLENELASGECQLDMHFFSFDDESDESIYRSTIDCQPACAFTGDDCVYLGLAVDEGVRIIALDEDGMQGSIVIDPDEAFTDGTDFSLDSLRIDTRNGIIVMPGYYLDETGMYTDAVTYCNLDGSGLSVSYKISDDEAAAASGSSDSSEFLGYIYVAPCGTGLGIYYYYGASRTALVTNLDGSSPVQLYTEAVTSEDSGEGSDTSEGSVEEDPFGEEPIQST